MTFTELHDTMLKGNALASLKSSYFNLGTQTALAVELIPVKVTDDTVQIRAFVPDALNSTLCVDDRARLSKVLERTDDGWNASSVFYTSESEISHIKLIATCGSECMPQVLQSANEAPEAVQSVTEGVSQSPFSVGDVVKAKVRSYDNGGYVCSVQLPDKSWVRAYLSARHCAATVPEQYKRGTVLTCTVRKAKLRALVLDNIDYQNLETGLENLEVGTVLDGVVRKTADFGVFVSVLPGCDGMVHMTDISHNEYVNPHSFTKGEIVRVQVQSVDVANRRVSLSMKALVPDPWEDLQNFVGKTFEGTVSKIQPYGCFVHLSTLGIDVLVHNSAYPENFVPTLEETLFVVVQSVLSQEKKASCTISTVK